MEIRKIALSLFVGIIIGATLMLGGIYVMNNEGKESPVIEETYDVHDNEHEESITLNDDQIKELGIVLDIVSTKNIRLHKNLTGEIVPDPDKLAHIVPRFQGIVKKVYKEIGDKVSKDEVIAIIESNESLVTYEVTSSMNGSVLDMHMTPGELIGDDTHIVTIADLRNIWVELSIYQNDLNTIKVGQTAETYYDKIENAVSGKIFYISPTVDEHTRTATARVRLSNNNGYWRPGMFVTSRIKTQDMNIKHAVKLSAIQNLDGQKVVFTKNANHFIPQPITIGRSNNEYVEVLRGLLEGQTYIAEGAFTFKAEILKESFSGDHGH